MNLTPNDFRKRSNVSRRSSQVWCQLKIRLALVVGLQPGLTSLRGRGTDEFEQIVMVGQVGGARHFCERVDVGGS